MTPSDDVEKTIAFECKEDGCDERVHYERKVVFGFTSTVPEPAGDKVVYLTCCNRHTHRYVIKED